LPSGTLARHPTKTLGGGDGEFTIWEASVCSPMSKAALLQALPASVTAHGWRHSDYFPANGEVEAPCGDLACWAKDTRYVTLNNVEDGDPSSSVTYHLRLATPPPTPQCGGPPSYSYFLFSQPAFPGITDGYDHIALPPLTDQWSGGSAASNHLVELCSAGSATMLKAFIAKQLLASGWVPQSDDPQHYKYANTYDLWIEDGDGPYAKARLHWISPYVYSP
jgi:hypothetical protein